MKTSLWSDVVALVGKVAGWGHAEPVEEQTAPSAVQVQRGQAALRRLKAQALSLQKQGVDHDTFRDWVSEGRRL